MARVSLPDGGTGCRDSANKAVKPPSRVIGYWTSAQTASILPLERIPVGPIFHFPSGGVQFVAQPIRFSPVLRFSSSGARICQRFDGLGYRLFARHPMLQRESEDAIELRERRALLCRRQIAAQRFPCDRQRSRDVEIVIHAFGEAIEIRGIRLCLVVGR